MIDKEIQESEEKARRLEEETVLKTFWSESESIVMKAPSGHKLKDVARYEVRVKENIVPEGDLQELDAEKKVLACTVILCSPRKIHTSPKEAVLVTLVGTNLATLPLNVGSQDRLGEFQKTTLRGGQGSMTWL